MKKTLRGAPGLAHQALAKKSPIFCQNPGNRDPQESGSRNPPGGSRNAALLIKDYLNAFRDHFGWIEVPFLWFSDPPGTRLFSRGPPRDPPRDPPGPPRDPPGPRVPGPRFFGPATKNRVPDELFEKNRFFRKSSRSSIFFEKNRSDQLFSDFFVRIEKSEKSRKKRVFSKNGQNLGLYTGKNAPTVSEGLGFRTPVSGKNPVFPSVSLWSRIRKTGFRRFSLSGSRPPISGFPGPRGSPDPEFFVPIYIYIYI